MNHCSSETHFSIAKERRLIGKPPVSKTGTAGSIPAAPVLEVSRAEGIEGSLVNVTYGEHLVTRRVADRKHEVRKAPIPAAPVLSKAWMAR